jgi:hypothetical protein
MCEFVSCVKKKGAKGIKYLFLTDSLLKTPKGKATLKKYKDYICGHGAVRFYFGLGEGVERFEGADVEYTDFSTPANFPAEIVKAIKDCNMIQIGGLPDCVFTEEGLAKVEANVERAKANVEWVKAYAEWEKAYASIKWKVFADPLNRIEIWR